MSLKPTRLREEKPESSSFIAIEFSAHSLTELAGLHRDKVIELLAQFDVDIRYGPCIGLTRIERWNRAQAFKLNPPKEVIDWISDYPDLIHCLWHQYYL